MRIRKDYRRDSGYVDVTDYAPARRAGERVRARSYAEAWRERCGGARQFRTEYW